MLFPKCEFDVLTTDGSIIAGRENKLALQLNAPVAIPRANALYMKFEAAAWIGYGSGKNRSVARRSLMSNSFQRKLPAGGLPAGISTYPFSLEIPPWMPDAYAGNDCGVRLSADVRLDVDWALDPQRTFAPRVVHAPTAAQKAPLFLRSDASFHTDFVLEVALDSAMVVSGDLLRGTVALRSGGNKNFDGIVLSVLSQATAVFSQMTQRTSPLVSFRIPAKALRGGEPVPFAIPIGPQYPVTIYNGVFDVSSLLQLELDIPWAFDPSLRVPITILPLGSDVHGEDRPVVLGSQRVAGLAAHAAAALGVPAATPPQVFCARTGIVTASLTDTAREGRIGTTVRFDYPDLNLGFESHEMGILDGFRNSDVLPAGLRERYFLETNKSHRDPKTTSSREAFVRAATAGLRQVDAFCISSHHLTWYVEYTGNEAEFVERLGRFLLVRAAEIHDAAMGLPVPSEATSHAEAWRRAAEGLGLTAPPTVAGDTQPGAHYVPSVPAIIGLRTDVRVMGGELRSFSLDLSTEWIGRSLSEARTVLSFRPLGFVFGTGRDAQGSREGGIDMSHPLLSRLREQFPEIIHAQAAELRVGHAGLSPDPAGALALSDALVAWALESRSEQRADAPYR